MIWRILTSFFFVECLLALSIALVWQANNVPVHTLQFGEPVFNFLRSCNLELSKFKIELPHITELPPIAQVGIDVAFLSNPAVAFIDAFIVPLNTLIRIGNVLVDAINYFVKVIEFVIIVIGKFLELRDELVIQGVEESAQVILSLVR